MSGQRDVARDEAFAAMVESGMTFTDIGALVGLTCERVRQIVERVGIERGVRHRSVTGYSVTMIMAAVRDGRVTTASELAVRAGCCYLAIREVLTALGRWDAVTRLLRMRRRAQRRARAVMAVHAFIAAYGEAPTASNATNAVIRRARPLGVSAGTVYSCFGSFTDLWLAAGLRPAYRRRRPRAKVGAA